MPILTCCRLAGNATIGAYKGIKKGAISILQVHSESSTGRKFTPGTTSIREREHIRERDPCRQGKKTNFVCDPPMFSFLTDVLYEMRLSGGGERSGLCGTSVTVKGEAVGALKGVALSFLT